jgi:gliding motility-associated-like protein
MSLQVVVLGNPTVSLSMSDSLICAGKEINFAGTLYLGYDSVEWNFGDNSLINNVNPVQHAFDKAGNYTVNLVVTYKYCPPVTAAGKVQVLDLPRVNLGPDTSMCPWSLPLTLSNLAYDTIPATYMWSTGDNTATTSAGKPGIYWLRATNSAGCSIADSIEVFKSCYLDIPNVFTPNGDGVNDYFFPRQFLSKQLVKFHMEIFNRWGELIFTTDNINGRGWDGKFNNQAQPSGVYVYMIDAIADGMSEEKIHGNVTLIR